MSSASERLRNPRERETRAERILDATAELLLRFGYRRVTIDDVARRADIGKGTVYLHWKTRDDLFRAVFEREMLGAVEELLEILRRDAGAWRVHRLARSYFLAIMSRPLLSALSVGDSELLGKLARPGNGARENRHTLMSHSYFVLLAEHGMLREDMSADEIADAFLATFEGFIRAAAASGAEPGTETRADLLARTVERAFETGRDLPPAAARTVASQVTGLIARLADADRNDLGG